MDYMMSTHRPIRWTLDVSLAGQIDDDGKIYVWAGGPIEAPHVKKVHVRADGKIDGRSAGVRKCGRCGESGHNKRTCTNKPIERPPAPPKKPSGRKCSACGKPGHNSRTCKVAKAKKEAKAKKRAALSVPEQIAAVTGLPLIGRPKRTRKKTAGGRKCGKCGKTGHNARTCGRK